MNFFSTTVWWKAQVFDMLDKWDSQFSAVNWQRNFRFFFYQRAIYNFRNTFLTDGWTLQYCSATKFAIYFNDRLVKKVIFATNTWQNSQFIFNNHLTIFFHNWLEKFGIFCRDWLVKYPIFINEQLTKSVIFCSDWLTKLVIFINEKNWQNYYFYQRSKWQNLQFFFNNLLTIQQYFFNNCLMKFAIFSRNFLLNRYRSTLQLIQCLFSRKLAKYKKCICIILLHGTISSRIEEFCDS